RKITVKLKTEKGMKMFGNIMTSVKTWKIRGLYHRRGQEVRLGGVNTCDLHFQPLEKASLFLSKNSVSAKAMNTVQS
ncbi:MAG TPA: hypothetical protein VNI77_01555, partial [Nitrososphaera sp.]|nr:hypothetical protein [Nitrososphaera sp.]